METSLEKLREKQAKIAAMPGNTVTEWTTPISKAKSPLSAEEYYKLYKAFSYWGVQMAGDYSVYYSRNMSQFMHTHTRRGTCGHSCTFSRGVS